MNSSLRYYKTEEEKDEWKKQNPCMRKDGKVTRHRKDNCSICFSCIICKPPPSWCTLVSHDTAKKSAPSKRMATELDSLETDLLPEKRRKQNLIGLVPLELVENQPEEFDHNAVLEKKRSAWAELEDADHTNFTSENSKTQKLVSLVKNMALIYLLVTMLQQLILYRLQ